MKSERVKQIIEEVREGQRDVILDVFAEPYELAIEQLQVIHDDLARQEGKVVEGP